MTPQLADAVFWAARERAEALIEVDEKGHARRFNFDDLDRLSKATAAHLISEGIRPGDRVALVGDNSAEHVVALLGVLRAGAVCCLINTKLPSRDRSALIEETGAVFTLADTAYLAGGPGLDLGGLFDLPDRVPAPLALDEAALAVIMFTSGSSGLPKGVPIRHVGYSWALKQFTGLGETMTGETGVVAAPLFHMNGQFHVMNLLSVGARVVLLKGFSAPGMLSAIAEYRAKRVTGVPTMAALMAEAIEAGGSWDVSSVQQVGLGSSPLSQQLLDRIQAAFPNAAITNGFGTTETGPVSFGPHPDGLPTPPTALGYPMAGVELKLVGGPSPDQGVLHIRNPMTLTAYWKRPEASTKRIDEDGWYITGDRMRRDGNGFYFFVGRDDDMMQVGAENVYPAEVEALLERHPAVTEAIVVPVPHATKNEAPVAFVMTDGSVSEEDLKAMALADGPAYAHPRRVFFVSAFPLATTNKIDRAALARDALQRVGGSL